VARYRLIEVRIALATLALLAALPRLAQASPVRGAVVDRDGAPVAGAQVLIGAAEVTTDADGTFAVDDAGNRPLDAIVIADGYDVLVAPVVPGRPVRLVMTPGDGVSGVEVIELSAEAPPLEEAAPYDLGADTVRTVPGAGNDALKALQSLPGVARIPFGLGGLVLRGQSPRASSVFLDGVEVPLLYHFGGLASFFPTSMLGTMELVPGNASVRWGRNLGGVVELTARTPATDRWRAGGEVSLIDAQARGEGPLGGGGLAIGLRRSYVDAILAAAAPSLTLAPRYADGQLLWQRGRAEAAGGRWTALVFGSDDLLTFTRDPNDPMDDGTAIEYRSRFARAALSWSRERGPWRVAVAPSVGADEVALTVDGSGITRRNVPASLRAEAERRWSAGGIEGRLAGGIDAVATRSSFDIKNQAPAIPGMPRATEETRRTGVMWAGDLGLWTEGVVRVADGRLGFKPGLRLDRFGLADQWVLDPRLTITQELPRGVISALAIGRHSQPPAPTDFDPAFGDQQLTASSSLQTSLKVAVPLTPATALEATAYWERSSGLPVDAVSSATAQAAGGPQGGGASAASRELADEQFGSYSYRESTGRGRGGGVELLVRKRAGSWTGWLAYTLSSAERRGDPRVDPVWRKYVLDQPHVLTALASVPLGTWQVGARVRFASGNPYTPVAGSYFDVDRQDYRAIDGPILSQRLPDFFQLDVRVDRTWQRPWGSLALFLDVQNVTNRVNPEGLSYNFDYSRRDYTRGLPVFPSLGLEYRP
jgi:hypothetical protein